jgi:hypothetical protein
MSARVRLTESTLAPQVGYHCRSAFVSPCACCRSARSGALAASRLACTWSSRAWPCRRARSSSASLRRSSITAA